MSEQEQEREDVEAPEQTPEPLEDDEAAEEEERASRDEEEPEEPAEESEQAAPEGMSEKQLEQGRKKLEAEGTRHRNRISEIIGEEANSLVPCPLCAGFVDGLIFPVQPPDDVVAAVRVAIGMPDLSNYQQARNARQCPDCAGLGVVLSGSLVSQNVGIDCATCNASGYVMVKESGEMTGPTVITNGGTEAQTFAGVNPDDPAVKELQARGFTVIPPMAPLTGPTAQ